VLDRRRRRAIGSAQEQASRQDPPARSQRTTRRSADAVAARYCFRRRAVVSNRVHETLVADDELARRDRRPRRPGSAEHRAGLTDERRVYFGSEQADAETIATIDMPWAESAAIDSRSYVPLVNGDRVRSLSSGGLKTIANFGFYLAQLQVRLRGYPTYLPPFIVIDSPRKNFGSNEEDAESMRRFCRTLWARRAQRTGTDFQVIVADNDSPSEERDQFELLELDRNHPLVDAARLQSGGGRAERALTGCAAHGQEAILGGLLGPAMMMSRWGATPGYCVGRDRWLRDHTGAGAREGSPASSA